MLVELCQFIFHPVNLWVSIILFNSVLAHQILVHILTDHFGIPIQMESLFQWYFMYLLSWLLGRQKFLIAHFVHFFFAIQPSFQITFRVKGYRLRHVEFFIQTIKLSQSQLSCSVAEFGNFSLVRIMALSKLVHSVTVFCVLNNI